MLPSDELYLKRCYELARQGGRATRPNPMVGAVVVHHDRIIGEGYHQSYGGPHAEVNAIANVSGPDRELLSSSTLYVSLEPCYHHGKTPPCVDLVLQYSIPTVVIALMDPTDKVNGKSIAKLQNHGVTVRQYHMQEAKDLIAEFTTINTCDRPYIQLKWAKSKDNYIGQYDRQVHLTAPSTNMYSHSQRAYTDAIMIGTNTAAIDDPALTQRHFSGPSPMRIVLDRTGRLPASLQLYTDQHPTITITDHTTQSPILKDVIRIDFSDENALEGALAILRNQGIYHLMVEGGAGLLQSIISKKLWDEAYVITTPDDLGSGIPAPHIEGRAFHIIRGDKDTIHRLYPS